jgi:hypothetical protein
MIGVVSLYPHKQSLIIIMGVGWSVRPSVNSAAGPHHGFPTITRVWNQTWYIATLCGEPR